jgi:hypothetical protein
MYGYLRPQQYGAVKKLSDYVVCLPSLTGTFSVPPGPLELGNFEKFSQIYYTATTYSVNTLCNVRWVPFNFCKVQFRKNTKNFDGIFL